MNISRRTTERISLMSSSLHATWLDEWLKIDETGVLTDISPDGFGGIMNRAPAVGHLFHARLCLTVPDGNLTCLPIEVDAQLRRWQRPDFDNELGSKWIVHCTIESIHPTDKRKLMRAIGMDQQG